LGKNGISGNPEIGISGIAITIHNAAASFMLMHVCNSCTNHCFYCIYTAYSVYSCLSSVYCFFYGRCCL